MFSGLFYLFFWKINLVLLWLGELLGHKSKYVMAISGQMMPAEVLAWLLMWVLSHETISLHAFVKGMLLLTSSLQSRQDRAGGKSLHSGIGYWMYFIPDMASALWNWPWWVGIQVSSPPGDRTQLSGWISPSWVGILKCPLATDVEDSHWPGLNSWWVKIHVFIYFLRKSRRKQTIWSHIWA